MQFELLGRTINISDGRKNYMKVLSFYKDLADTAAADFSEDYEKTFALTFFSSSYCEKLAKKYGKNEMTAYGGGQRPLVRSRTAAVRSE